MHYAQNLESYYRALSVGDSHNYYMGRADGSVTPFLSYFCTGMAGMSIIIPGISGLTGTR